MPSAASAPRRISSTRRVFLARTAAMAGASVLGLPRLAAAEPPPEIPKIRLVHSPAICTAPQYLAEELLHLEGFSEVEYVEMNVNTSTYLTDTDKADIAMDAAPALVAALATGGSSVALAGIHAGCYELLGNGPVQAIRDLKGKSVAISGFKSAEHIFVSSMIAYVGMDPAKDVQWRVGNSSAEAMRLFAEDKADAYMAFAPQPQELRAKKIGHVIVNTTQDRPWSQYFCCMVTGRRDFVAKHPVAAKRAVRAFLKAADICAQEPERAARLLVAKGFEPRYDLALEILRGLPYRRWREANPEDTLRFHALRLHEVGMIKTNPQKLIAQGTEWRFLNELRKELKT
jgi:NitT/TauT family transport system substrate-binding protein